MTRDISLLPPGKGFISFLVGKKSANKKIEALGNSSDHHD